TGQNARHQVVVAWAPDQMRSKRHGGKVRAVGLEDVSFGDRLASRIMGVMAGRIWDRLVDAGHVVTVEHHAGRGGVDEPADALVAAGADDVARADDVGAVVVEPAAAKSCPGGDVKDDVASGAGTEESA